MKKYKLLFLLLLLIPFNAKAISVTGMSCSPSSVTSGDDFTATITVYLDSPGYFEMNSGNMVSASNLRSTGGTNSVFTDVASSSYSFTHSFKALDPGTGTIFFTANVSDENGNEEIVANASCNISISAIPTPEPTPAPSNNSASVIDSNSSNKTSNTTNKKGSNDSSLKSISISNGKLSPSFDPEVYNYTVGVNYDIEKITLSAEKNSDSSNIDGLGEKELKVGINEFKIRVEAENGEARTYTIIVTRKEKDAIEITINKKKYTVIKEEGILNVPEGFIKTSVIIDKQEITAYSNEYTGYILVGLIDDKGKASWYIYNSKNSTYTKYNEVSSKKLRLVILDAPSKIIPSNFKKTTLDLEDGEVVAYKINGVKNFKYVYAINMNNGEKGFYEYDIDEETFQRYNKELTSSYNEEIKLFEMIIVGAGALVLIMFIIILGISSSNRKLKKGLKTIKEDRTIDKLVKEENKSYEPKKEEPRVEPEETSDEEEPVNEGLSKKELKRLKKEEKRKLKEMQDDFLS